MTQTLTINNIRNLLHFNESLIYAEQAEDPCYIHYDSYKHINKRKNIFTSWKGETKSGCLWSHHAVNMVDIKSRTNIRINIHTLRQTHVWYVKTPMSTAYVVRSKRPIHCIFQGKCSLEIGKERPICIDVNGCIVPHDVGSILSGQQCERWRLTINVLNPAIEKDIPGRYCHICFDKWPKTIKIWWILGS